ncbi:cyclodeaminase/cyclohydrolase family protein [Haloplanus sp. C73]|uniref:cyclodeaminase/cyclohydrolase family protein n=1 Tax=Haloplanus sp. C73 TaxID=3421641 RepID=UPI003EBCCE5F
MTSNRPAIERFLGDIASEHVAPAGGTATAVVGAVGASLCEMVCIHTAESDAATELADVRADLSTERGHLLDLAEADATLVDDLFGGAAGAPDDADIERAVGVPLAIAESCLTVLELAGDVTATGAPTALADAATGVTLTHAALQAALFTARRNLDRLDDTSFVDETERRLAELEVRADDTRDRAMRHVEAE